MEREEHPSAAAPASNAAVQFGDSSAVTLAVDEPTIITEMAKAVAGDPIPRGSIQKNIYISAMRQPGD